MMLDKDIGLERRELGICVSGGLDSTLAVYWALLEGGYKESDIMYFNFDIGQPYAAKEQKVLASIFSRGTVKTFHLDLIRKDLNNIPTEEKYIIPARNLIFATIAAGFVKRVWVMGMKYENHYKMSDKNDMFYHTATVACTQAVGQYTLVESPFITLTKTDIIKFALKWNLQTPMGKTTSCYHPDHLRCGKCSLCFKRYIAMKANGIDEKYETDPTHGKEADKLMASYMEAWKNKDFTHYEQERIEETFKVLGVKYE